MRKLIYSLLVGSALIMLMSCPYPSSYRVDNFIIRNSSSMDFGYRIQASYHNNQKILDFLRVKEISIPTNPVPSDFIPFHLDISGTLKKGEERRLVDQDSWIAPPGAPVNFNHSVVPWFFLLKFDDSFAYLCSVSVHVALKKEHTGTVVLEITDLLINKLKAIDEEDLYYCGSEGRKEHKSILLLDALIDGSFCEVYCNNKEAFDKTDLWSCSSFPFEFKSKVKDASGKLYYIIDDELFSLEKGASTLVKETL